MVIANAYYIHPIIGEVAAHFGVSEGAIGIVPALNQLALALGILLLLPLGDFLPNRTLCIIFVAAQSVFMLAMVLAESFLLFTTASTLLGFVTIAPYLIPAFASKRVAPERLGQVTALLAAGVILGILVARVGAGVIAEEFGWRAVYWCAFALMVAVTAALPLTLASAGSTQKQPQTSYANLLVSVFTLARANRDMLISACIQGLNFGSFIAIWLSLALHLTSPAMGYGVDTVGYLAGIAAVSIFTTPRLGRIADRVGPRRARCYAAAIQLAGLALLYPLGWSVWTLAIPILISNVVGPSVDVTGRMTFLALDPAIRTRLTTSYIVVMFLGGAIGSVAGTAVYDTFGWAGTSALLFMTTLCSFGLSLWALKRWMRASA